MRITNKIMQDNSLYNINSNKVSQNNLSTQMSTQKKINRPSDDPVIAIRSLRLRSSVSQISQYYEKNVPDAESWIKVTEDALSTVAEVVTDLVKQATKAANSDLKSDDLDIIIQNMEALEEEVFATGNVDYAGRYGAVRGFISEATGETYVGATADIGTDSKCRAIQYSADQRRNRYACETDHTDLASLAGGVPDL